MNKITRYATNWGLAFTLAVVLLKLLNIISVGWIWVAVPLLVAFTLVFLVTPLLPPAAPPVFLVRGKEKKKDEEGK